MALSGDVRPVPDAADDHDDTPSLRRRMTQAGWLFAGAGIISFIGFLMVAVGFAEPIPLTTGSGLGWAFVSGLVAWGIGLIGLGVMLGFFGAAVKGPSVEWRDIAPEHEGFPPQAHFSPGTRYACPGCGGDVYTSQTICPECGQHLRVVAASAR